ncbi:transcription initiation factor TFIID subunit 7-like isoform X2 [Anoplophora glabripennis]|uniref:transcription initiation factor TFIID subunit 7-like isoform X2 n=1 Tax=Anoplophora glabripennis TaxID=217634 RepID=UPI000873D83B|nr:transcription initiation factor TFIID subunit 7-like isoform X2 [Anoplophora glabripennis]
MQLIAENKMELEEDKIDLEEQFILRLPYEEACKLRELLQTKPEKVKKLSKIYLNPDENEGSVYFAKSVFYGTLKKLPTIIESYKTNICNDTSTLFKTADISQMLDCSNQGEISDKKDTIHGYCPPLKNVKTKRFRKTMYNTDFAIEAESVTKELYYLLSTDLEAASSKFEILYEGTSSSKQYETSLFGHLSSDSELSDNSA